MYVADKWLARGVAAAVFLPLAYGALTVGVVLAFGSTPSGQVLGAVILLSIVAVPAAVLYYADGLREALV